MTDAEVLGSKHAVLVLTDWVDALKGTFDLVV